MGGLYVRYAIGYLYDGASGRIGGLTACDVFIIASPNLGVRLFMMFRFISKSMWNFSNVVCMDTMKQLLFMNEEIVTERIRREKGGVYEGSRGV